MTDLTRINKPFGELDAATKGALLLAAHEVIQRLVDAMGAAAYAIGDLGDDLTYFPSLREHNLHTKAFDIMEALNLAKEQLK